MYSNYAHSYAIILPQCRGQSLNDWESLQVASDSWARPAESIRKKFFELKHHIKRHKLGMDWDMDFFV